MPLLYEDCFPKHFSQTKDTEITLPITAEGVTAILLTVNVKDAITQKPISNANIKVDTITAMTNAEGIASLTVTPGTLIISVTHKEYLPTAITLQTSTDKTVNLTMTPIWVVAVGILTCFSTGLIIGAKLLWRK